MKWNPVFGNYQAWHGENGINDDYFLYIYFSNYWVDIFQENECNIITYNDFPKNHKKKEIYSIWWQNIFTPKKIVKNKTIFIV